MNKKVIALLLILMTIFCATVYADDIDFKISDAERNIRNASSIDINYSSGMVINSEILDIPVQAAIEKKKEYATSEEQQYKDLQTDVVINLKNTSKKINLLLDAELSDYSAFVDNIIINSDGIYCFISPSELSLKKGQMLELNIKDNKNIVAKYNGTAQIEVLKKILLCLFIFIAIYVLLFILLYVRKMNFKEGFKIKNIYFIGIFIIVLSVVMSVLACFADVTQLAERKTLNLVENDNSIFEVNINENLLKGVSLGIPPYKSNFNVDLITACKKSENELEGDKIIGGKYISNMRTFKFPITSSGSYYIKNNSVTFNDVNENDEGLYEAISILASKNILNGKADGIYGVDDTLTRAESVTMFCKMLNLDEKVDSNEKFEDINNSDWFYNYVMTGKKYAILSGYDDNTFRANNTITRQEFAAILGQIMKNRYGYALSDDVSNLSVYEDNEDISLWAKEYVSLLERANINIWEQNYLPQQPITRGEAAIMLYRGYCISN